MNIIDLIEKQQSAIIVYPTPRSCHLNFHEHVHIVKSYFGEVTFNEHKRYIKSNNATIQFTNATVHPYAFRGTNSVIELVDMDFFHNQSELIPWKQFQILQERHRK